MTPDEAIAIKEPRVSTLRKAENLFIGALAKPRLQNAILEALVADEAPALPLYKEKIKAHLAQENRPSVVFAYQTYCHAWGEKRLSILRKPSSQEELEKKNQKKVQPKVIIPLWQMAPDHEGKPPDPKTPWLGRLLIEAAEGENNELITAVNSHLERFGLDAALMVKGVRDTLSK